MLLAAISMIASMSSAEVSKEVLDSISKLRFRLQAGTALTNHLRTSMMMTCEFLWESEI